MQLGAQILNLGRNGHLHFEKGRFENIFSSWENMSLENFEIEKIEFSDFVISSFGLPRPPMETTMTLPSASEVGTVACGDE